MTARREHLPYVAAFRGVAMLMVILTHTPSIMTLWQWPSAQPWGFFLVQNATVFFVFISGFLFAHLHDTRESAASFCYRKLKRMFLPYVVAALPGIIYVSIVEIRGIDARYLIKTLATGTGHWNHPHWYVPFILLVFASYPLLAWLQQRRTTLLVTTAAALVVGVFSFRSFRNENPLVSLLHFGGVFLAGMVASRHRPRLEELGTRYAALVVVGSAVAFAVALSLVPISRGLSMEQVIAHRLLAIDFTFIGKIVLIPGVLVTLKRLTDAGWKLRPLSLLAESSLGLFLWHVYFIEVLNYYVPSLQRQQGLPRALALSGMQLAAVLIVVGGLLRLSRRLVGPKSVYLTGY